MYIEGNVSGWNYVGLLAGYSQRFVGYTATSGSVSGIDAAGGILGYIDGNIEYCVNYADVTSQSSCGGIVDSGWYAIIRCCKNYGSITSTSPYVLGSVGGIVGGFRNYSIISDCGNYGNVSGPFCVGGIIGYAGVSPIINCFNNGDIRLIFNNPKYDYGNHGTAGGIVGSTKCSVENCYSSGTISIEEGVENEYIGGICGQMDAASSNSIAHNYWLQEGISAVGGEIERLASDDGYGGNVIENCFRLNQAQMKGVEPYEGVLYRTKDGKSCNTLLEALNAFLKDFKDKYVPFHPLWEYSSIESFPVLSETFYSN